MNTLARCKRNATNASVMGLFLGLLMLTGCITTNCADCGKDNTCTGGPGVCGTTEITQAGDSSGCNVGTFKCTDPSTYACNPLKICKTLGAPNCTCACRTR